MASHRRTLTFNLLAMGLSIFVIKNSSGTFKVIAVLNVNGNCFLLNELGSHLLKYDWQKQTCM